ncbi:hypothetical protein [Streptomyces fungicidicus]|uniref:hypothetical protein n=1 Tax=Streptomyces fungicidicus TaxID=68203 RepID=UPI003D70402C
MDENLFQRLEKKILLQLCHNRITPKWEVVMFLNLSLRKRVIQLAEQSDKIGKNGYQIKELARDRFAGEKAVYFNTTTVGAGRLLLLINLKKSINLFCTSDIEVMSIQIS